MRHWYNEPVIVTRYGCGMLHVLVASWKRMAYLNRTSREILRNLNGFAYVVIVTVAFRLLIHARTRVEDSGSSPIKSGRPVTQIFLYA
jgi:hypothetical protein